MARRVAPPGRAVAYNLARRSQDIVANQGVSRRYFFFGSLLAGAVPAGGFGAVASLKKLGFKSPNEKLNIAGVGVGGKGFTDLSACAETENIVALADPDEKRAARTFEKFPNAPRYKDFRQMFDKELKNIDAVTVSCPDHMHASVANWAMTRGKSVYVQKPLTRTVWEAQQLLKTANETGVATQMGNQGYSNEGARQCCEIIWSGEIGEVGEVHAWTNRPWKYWPQGPEVEPKETSIPSTLDWDAWLGDAEYRPFSPAYVPHNWRGFPDFGCGAIGDMACHILGTPNMALRLGTTAPIAVECVSQEGKSKYTFPKAAVIRFDFPARGAMGPVSIWWHDGLYERPDFPGVEKTELLGDSDVNGSLFIGSKGMVTTGCYGERTRLAPAAKMLDYKMPEPFLTRSPGVISMRYEGKLLWDAQKGLFSNNADANQYLKPKFRKGWKFA